MENIFKQLTDITKAHGFDILSEQVKELKSENKELRATLLVALSFIADLNGSEWIRGDGVGELDMSQRATALQQRLYNSVKLTKTHDPLQRI